MRRIFCAALLAASSARASEFGKQGQFLPAGGVALIHSSTGNDSDLRLLIEPQLAWFAADHFAVGIVVRYEIDKATRNGIDQGTRASSGLEPFAAYDLLLSPWLSV